APLDLPETPRLAQNITYFARALRRAGLPVGPGRILTALEAIAAAVEAVAALPDPVGAVMEQWDRPNGLRIARVRVPLGVIGIIYESRPNVTADAAALCLRSGNAAILRGGSESHRSSSAIFDAMHGALVAAGMPEHAVQMVRTTDRAAVGELLQGLNGTVDVLVPRGGKNLIARVQSDARVPVIGHLEGLCHVYVDAGADSGMAQRIAVDAKLRRTGICGAAETLLLDANGAEALKRDVLGALIAAGCEVRGDASVQALDARVVAANDEDWRTEYLAPVISAAEVAGVDGALAHIAQFGSGHTEAIVTDDAGAADRFLGGVDSAIVLHNASTQFADGGEFGM
ncbi:MAG: glutamate-5-semialdehyde dehydrogenase, partial [Pseudomonadota bacterium]